MLKVLLYIPRKIWAFLSWLRGTILNLFLLAILVSMGIAISQKETPTIASGSPLYVNPEGFLVDQLSYVPATALLLSGDNKNPETRVRDLVEAIHLAATDDRIPSMVLDLNGLGRGSLSKLSEVGSALTFFRSQGKEITAVADSYDQSRYFLASFADKIYMDPLGSVSISGFASYRQYYKDALDKLNVSVHVFQAGNYKDAVEPFLRNEMSEESREHTATWINDLWQSYTSQVERNRNLTEGKVEEYITSYTRSLKQISGDAAQLALQSGLIDRLTTRQQQHQLLKENAGESINFRKYLSISKSTPQLNAQEIAVITASGNIVEGHQPPGIIGAETLNNMIADARENDRVKAVVIRIDSGGGSAFASELIRRELDETRAAGKPVLISMSSVAASGGYWLSLGADQIWAAPTTITGSIGVFGIIPTFEDSFKALGIHTDGLGTTAVAGGDQLDRPMHPHIEEALQANVDNLYQRFITLTADARKRQPEDIHNIAQGRVWSGAQAQALGLVDQLGFLTDVVNTAAELAGLKPGQYRATYPSIPLSPGEQFLQKLSEEVQVSTNLKLSPLAPLRTLQSLPQWQQWQWLAQITQQSAKPVALCAVCVVP